MNRTVTSKEIKLVIKNNVQRQDSVSLLNSNKHLKNNWPLSFINFSMIQKNKEHLPTYSMRSELLYTKTRHRYH